MKQYDAGLSGEAMAEKYLCEKGMQCLARRFRAEDGEIDLVMLDGETVVMTEVKYRPRGYAGDGVRAVSAAKQRRMTHAAMSFLMQREWMDHPVRFDIVEITADGILHIPHAFIPGWH